MLARRLGRSRGVTWHALCLTIRLASNTSSSSASPPAWVAQLRSDAKAMEKSISYDIKIYDELAWRRRPFTFDKQLWDPLHMSAIVRRRLCLGDEEAEYTVIGEAFPFPDREDAPVINEPQRMCKLLWDHNSATEKIMIQLSEHFPPLLWLTVRPTLSALKRVFSEFLDVDAAHMKKYLPYYEQVQSQIEAQTQEKLTETLSPSYIKQRFIEDMRKRDPRSLELDYANEHHLFLGTQPHFRLIEDAMMKANAFVFGWPLLLSDGNEHLESTPLRMAAFRTVYSKSLLLFHSRLDLQVDHRQTHLPGDNNEDVVLEMLVFCQVNYADNTRLCGGSALVERFNTVMGTSYPLNMPVDVLAAFAREACVKSCADLCKELRFLANAAAKVPEVERVFRTAPDQLSTSRLLGQLAYTIVYLALLSYDRFVPEVFETYWQHTSDVVRVACAKGAQIVGRVDLVQKLIDHEPAGRPREMLCATLAQEATSMPSAQATQRD